MEANRLQDVLIISKESDFLHIQCGSIESPFEMYQYLSQVREVARDAGVSKLLIDAQGIGGHLTTMERFDLSVALAEFCLGLEVAVILDVSFYDPERFGETVANNRGALLRVFTNPEDARDWIKRNSANEQDTHTRAGAQRGD